MELGEQQRLFTNLVGKLIIWVYEQHKLSLTLGEAYRPPETALIYAQKGIGIKNSLHIKKLAIDLNLFIDGTFRTDVQAYGPLGVYWKSLHPLCRWGGDFKTVDADHFSMEFEGVR